MTNKAFLVGINDYYPIGVGGQDLGGCVNDVQDMANTLVICGFRPNDILICTDNRATKANMTKGIGSLITNSKPNDSIVFYYSGHGSQMRNTDEESDMHDEVLCPHDMDFGNNSLSDNELSNIFSKLPKDVNLEVILDCCHSGTGTRELVFSQQSTRESSSESFTTLEEFNKSNILVPRYMEPPIDVKFYLDYTPNAETKWLLSPLEKSSSKSSRKRDTREIVLDKLNHTLWAGCRDNQLSYETEIKGVRRGIFTYNLCEILRKVEGKIKRDKLYKLLNAAVQRMNYPQNPQLETSKPDLLDMTFA